jgi:hypothetical protein
MADAKDPSTKDLLLLITGFEVPKSPPVGADKGDVYWLKQATTNEDRELRDSEFNPKWLKSPEAAWNDVRFRDWLLATLFCEIAGKKHDFVAIEEPLLASIDVFTKDFTKDMKGVSPSIIEALKTKDGRPRSLFNTLSIGVSRHIVNNREVFVVGAGMRRRARFWKTESMAIQADVEFFMPFWELQNSEPARAASNVQSINAGIAISYTDLSPLGTDEESKKDLIAVRFNLRAPFGTKWVKRPKSDEEQLETVFDPPVIHVQKRIRESAQHLPSEWHRFNEWGKFSEEFCETLEGRELLNVPIGPLLMEKIDDPTSIKDMFLGEKEVREEIKEDLTESWKEFKETMALLDNIWEVKSPDKDGAGPNSGKRRLGHLLESLGFMTSKGGAEAEYTFKQAKGLTVWDVINRIFAELDGTPLWVQGATPKTEKEARIAASLASQKSETDPTKFFFGLAGLFYNIPLITVPPGAPEKVKDKDDDARIVVSKDNFSKDKSIFLEKDEDKDGDKKKDEAKSTVELFLHLGKWLSDETLDDNWYQRLMPRTEGSTKPRVPVPGIRLLPIKRTRQVLEPPKVENQAVSELDRQALQEVGARTANFDWTFRADLLSIGFDVKSTTKEGMTFLEKLADHFGLGAVELRLALSFSGEEINTHKEWWERFSFGVGFKLKNLRLSFGPKEKKKEEEKKEKVPGDRAYGDELMLGLEDILSDEWLDELEPEKSKSPKVKTRLSAKKKDKFSISVGYLGKLTKDSKGTLDLQLYDEKGNRGKMAVIHIDRSLGPVYVRRIGIALKGLERWELSNGVPDDAQLTVAITGGLRFQVFELGFIGLKFAFPLNRPAVPKISLDGLDVSVKIGSVIISGSFFKVGIEYAGMLTVDIPKASFSAMGFYGSLRLTHVSREDDIIKQLDEGKIHDKLRKKLQEKLITPAASTPIKKGRTDEWELYTNDNTRYTITDDDDKLNVLRQEKTFFIYAMLNAASGCGPTFGPIQFTGIALGYGHNRRLKVPRIEEVADFPLVQMVMGEGGYQKDETSVDVRRQLGKPLEDPVAMLEKFKDHVVGEAGQQFACGGVRFTVSGVIDCFALLIVQWGDSDIELSIIGLARFRHPRDLKSPAICYVEMQLLISFKPREGTFQLQALLTSNSWVINKDCRLTGGFALFIWFDGEHKGDWVICLGGYHPRFVRPSHYPVVPRLGLNWAVDDKLTIKGGIYLAITPSCGMLGARMEAVFHSGRISAWFTAFLDVIVNWNPLYFEADIGISLRVEASLWLITLKVTIGVTIQMWGPPVGGVVHVDLAVISFDIDFGKPKPKPQVVTSWQQFCHDFLNLKGSDTTAVNNPVDGFAIVTPSLAAGRNNLSSLPNPSRKKPLDKRDDDLWIVRGDELELAAATVVPVANVNVGTVKTPNANMLKATNSSLEGVQDRSHTGKPVMVSQPLAIEKKALLRANEPSQKLSVHPMGKALDSTLNVTIVKDEVSGPNPVQMSGWTMAEELSALPAALWDPAKPNLRPSEPSAKLIPQCITGIKSLKPPRGKLGNEVVPQPIEWHRLDDGTVSRSTTSQEIPAASRLRDLRSVMVEKQDQQEKVVAGLKTAGFALTWQAPAPADVRFRELQADPLAGAVAA